MTYVIAAFYKAQGELFDYLVRAWEGGKYSHCEVLTPAGLWLSSSPRDGGVRYKDIEVDFTKWDFVAVPVNAEKFTAASTWGAAQVGKKYDWLGIFLSQVIPLCIEDPKKFFCSEFCIKFFQHLGYLKEVVPQAHGPNGFYRELVSLARTHDVKIIQSREEPYEYTEKVVWPQSAGACYQDCSSRKHANCGAP